MPKTKPSRVRQALVILKASIEEPVVKPKARKTPQPKKPKKLLRRISI